MIKILQILVVNLPLVFDTSGVLLASGTDLIASKELDKAITIEGKSTYIGASQDELSSKERHEYKQSGLTIAFSSAVTDAAMAVQSSLKRSEQVKDERLSQLLKVKAVNEAIETVDKAKKLIDTLKDASNLTQAAGNTDFKVSISVGASKSVSTSHTKQTTHQGSELSAGSVTVRATGGDNTIVGSKINAKEATLEGKNVTLLGTTDSQTNRSDNKSSSWSVGVFVGKSGGSTGLGIEGAASVGKGHSNSDSQVQNHTEINADRLTIKAKETTTLKGATANINHLALDTKNLHIESVQDIEKYDSKQTQGGVSASVAIYGSGSSVSAQGSRTKANVDYAQVTQQSGFNIKESSTINVEENTHLKGGVINAQGTQENHSLKTGTLTTESIENHSDIKVSTVTAGASTDMSQMATMAVGAALSALGNMSESERSQTQAAISSNINVQITDSEAQKQKTGKTAEETLQSLNRDVANANQKLDKQDLQALQERQEATQIVAEIGAKRVGDFAQYMGWEDGSPQKVALHGLIGYLSAKVGGGNTTASTLSAMGSEYINTEIANYLQENTALTADQRNAIQQASAAGLGALIGASLGGDSNTVNQSAQMAWRTEKFNRQLHPEEKQRIKDLANGDKEKEARLTAAACALVHCSAQIPSDDPEYAKAKALEDLGNSAEFASERALLSKQVGTIGDDAFAAGTLKPMFNYNNVYRAKDYDDANLQVLTRVGGAAQSVGGVAATVFGVGICETGMGCVGGVPIAAYGVDNAVAGARTIYSGKYHSTIGATALADLTGINPETAELIYSSPSMVFGVKPIAMGAAKATGAVANEVARVGGDVKYVAGELGKDVKAGGDLVNRLTAGIPHNKYVFGVTDRIGQGIESIENISPKKYLYISSVGYFASSTSQYIFNGDIDHSKSLKVGLMTPYLTLTSPATGMMVGAADTAISTKIEGKENYLKEQEKYLKSGGVPQSMLFII